MRNVPDFSFGKLGEHVATLMEEELGHPGHGRTILLECPIRIPRRCARKGMSAG